MRILKNNYYNNDIKENVKQIEPYPRKHICEQCSSELEYEKSDMRMGEYGCMFLKCPLCGQENMLEDNENSITLTKDNIIFPTHFSHISKDTGARDRANTDEVRKEIKNAIEYFRENKDEYEWYSWSGNLYIEVRRYSGDEEYDIMVSNDFYTMKIPFETEDCNYKW